MICSTQLGRIEGIKHGFFSREGGVSQGIYAGLNTGLGSSDDRNDVLANRESIRRRFAADHLITPYQYHSNVAVIAEEPWDMETPPRADAAVTAVPGLMIAVNTADCTPVIFADIAGEVVGIAHAGWQGAVSGILEATVEKMQTLGVGRGSIRAAIGPTISQANYEVGAEFRQRFLAHDAGNERFFIAATKLEHFMFDLPGYVKMRLNKAGVAHIDDCGLCTYAQPQRFFSYRRTTHQKEPDYGRQLSAVMREEK